jgi:cytoskeletal protein RodZ
MDELGRYLQAAREAANLSIDQLSRDTRIPVRTLEGLEKGQRDGLPEPVFLRGFVRSICRSCHADPGPALEILANEARARNRVAPRPDAAEPVPNRPPMPGPADDLMVGSQRFGQVNWTYLAILMVFVVGILVALLTVGTGGGPMDMSRRPDLPAQREGIPGLDGGGLKVR